VKPQTVTDALQAKSFRHEQLDALAVKFAWRVSEKDQARWFVNVMAPD
jgi:hypothetical protein